MQQIFYSENREIKMQQKIVLQYEFCFINSQTCELRFCAHPSVCVCVLCNTWEHLSVYVHVVSRNTCLWCVLRNYTTWEHLSMCVM